MRIAAEPSAVTALSHAHLRPGRGRRQGPAYYSAQATALANWIESFGKRLIYIYIYINCWHADHWPLASELAKRFPRASCVSVSVGL